MYPTYTVFVCCTVHVAIALAARVILATTASAGEGTPATGGGRLSGTNGCQIGTAVAVQYAFLRGCGRQVMSFLLSGIYGTYKASPHMRTGTYIHTHTQHHRHRHHYAHEFPHKLTACTVKHTASHWHAILESCSSQRLAQLPADPEDGVGQMAMSEQQSPYEEHPCG